MALYVGDIRINDPIFWGTNFIYRIYHGSYLAWQAWRPARADVAADLNGVGDKWLDIPELVPVGATTMAVDQPSRITIQGSKSDALVTVSCDLSGGALPNCRVRILLNESVVSTSGNSSKSFIFTWTGNLNQGDSLRFQYYGEGALFNRPVLKSSSYISAT